MKLFTVVDSKGRPIWEITAPDRFYLAKVGTSRLLTVDEGPGRRQLATAAAVVSMARRGLEGLSAVPRVGESAIPGPAAILDFAPGFHLAGTAGAIAEGGGP